MTLIQVIRAIERAAKAQPSVNMIVRSDIFRLNTYKDAKYGAFAWVQGQHSTTATDGMMRFAFTFIYADRLTADKANEVDVQSVGVQTLTAIIQRLVAENVFVSGNVVFNPYTQRFLDECAGVFANVTLEVRKTTMCDMTTGDFNDDFNDDFLIF